MLKKKGLSYNCKSNLYKTIHQNKLKKISIASKMLNMVYLTHTNINLKFGPKNLAVKLDKAGRPLQPMF